MQISRFSGSGAYFDGIDGPLGVQDRPAPAASPEGLDRLRMTPLRTLLANGGDMGRRIAAHDWSAHPFGPMEAWPGPLRAMLTLCLTSSFPTAIYWGPELRLLYNDAWTPIPGPRHPAALGSPGAEIWADIWDVVGPQLERVVQDARGFDVRDQLLEMTRFGRPEETYWDYSFTPIADERGRVLGILNQGQETTSRVLAARRGALLTRLAETLAPVEDADLLMQVAAGIVGEHFGAVRCGFAEFDQPAGLARIGHCWTDGSVGAFAGLHRLADFGGDMLAELERGRVYLIGDVASDGRCSDAERAAFAAVDVRAVLIAPFHINGRLAATLFLHDTQPRDWQRDHGELATTLVRRLWQDVARARAEAATRASERRQRVLIDELNHRVKNMLALVQSLALQSFKGDRPAGQSQAAFQARLGALATAHDILTRERWGGAALRELVAGAFGGGRAPDERIVIDGPPACLVPRAAISLALALHELAANARDHGALSRPGGAVGVSWTVEAGRLHLVWREVGGPRVSPPSRRGFGLRVIERGLASDLGGAVELSFPADGVRMTLDAPLPERTALPELAH